MSLADTINDTYEPHDDIKVARLEKFFAKRIADCLANAYPKIKWVVRCRVPTRQIIIQSPMISLENGYHLDMGKYTVSELEDRAVRAGSEILERYSIKRSRSTDESVAFEIPRKLFKPDEPDNDKMGVELDPELRGAHKS